MAAKVVNDLLDYDLKIVQDNNFFKFSLDSVMLAEFINFDLSDKLLLDLCTGNVPLPLIVSSKISKIVAVELQKEIYEIALESIKINKIDNITLINDNVKNIQNYFPGNNFDIITCNPPYFKYNEESIINISKPKALARHELEIKLEEIIKIAYLNLRNKGKFYLVHRADRIAEIIKELEKQKFGIKTIQMVHYEYNSNCAMILIESKKNSKSDTKILYPIFSKYYRREK